MIHSLPVSLALTVFLFCASYGGGNPAQGEILTPHNFLVIIADDVGVDKVGAYLEHPNAGPTPNIDQLAQDGVLFRNAWSNPTCSPTRSALLTGQHGFRTGVGRWISSSNPNHLGLDPNTQTIPDMLVATHTSAALGKWHMAGTGVLAPQHPEDCGFEYHAGSIYNLIGNYFQWTKHINGTSTVTTTYATRDTGDEAIAQIVGRPEPWLLWVAFNAPHVPMHVPPSNLSIPPDPTYNLATTFIDPNNPTTAEKHRAMSEAVDVEVGRIMAALTPDQLDHTTIIFLGDNGTQPQSTELPFLDDHAKGTVYEGGINVPFIVVSPEIPVAAKGTETQALVSVVDVMATIGELAGTPSTASDSVSFAQSLRDPFGPSARPTVYTEAFNPNGPPPYTRYLQAIRNPQFKLIREDCTYVNLYDLTADPFEEFDLFADGVSPTEQAIWDALEAEIDGLFVCNSPDPDDVDLDGIANEVDNCVDTPNVDQHDTNADGFGDVCDGDFDNDGVVGGADFIHFRGQFGKTTIDPAFDPVVDCDADGSIGGSDFICFRGSYGGPPGPSGLACALPYHDGSVPCTAQ